MGRRRNQAYAGRNSILQSSPLEELQPCRLKGAVSPTTRSIPAGYYFLSSEGSRSWFCIIDGSGSALPAPHPLPSHTAQGKQPGQNLGAAAGAPHIKASATWTRALKAARQEQLRGKGKGFGTVGHSIHISTGLSCRDVKGKPDPPTMALKQTELSEPFWKSRFDPRNTKPCLSTCRGRGRTDAPQAMDPSFPLSTLCLLPFFLLGSFVGFTFLLLHPKQLFHFLLEIPVLNTYR